MTLLQNDSRYFVRTRIAYVFYVHVGLAYVQIGKVRVCICLSDYRYNLSEIILNVA